MPNLGADSNPKEAKRSKHEGSRSKTGDGGRVLGGGRGGDGGGVLFEEETTTTMTPQKNYCRDSLFDSLEKKIWSQEGKIAALLKKGFFFF